MKTTAKITAMLLVLALAGPAPAEILTVKVGGVVDYVATDGGLALDGSVVVGSTMTGYCTYDSETPDLNPNVVNGSYALISISMTIGNYTIAHDPMSPDLARFLVSTVDAAYSAGSGNPRFDGTIYVDGSPQTYDDITWGYTELAPMNLFTSSSEYITTDALPDLDSWPDFSIFDGPKFFGTRFFDNGDGYFGIFGEVTSLTVIPYQPKTFYVFVTDGNDNNNGLSKETPFATIQKAIDSAFNGDTVLVADGTYTGDGNRDIDFLGKAITVRSESGSENCVIDCNGSWEEPHRGFYFHNTEDANSILDGFTITNGLSGIYCYFSSPTITNCIISGNSAYDGAGILCYESGPAITNCTITGNRASDEGGALWCSRGSPTITNCNISGNSASRRGGAIYLSNSDVTIANSTIVANTGHGIYGYSESSATIINSVLWNNSDSQIVGNAVATYCDIEGGWLGEGNIDQDPCFALITDYHLMPNSPCIDAGDPNYIPEPNETDLDGQPRIIGGRIDMGVYEHNPNSPAIAISASSVSFHYVRDFSEPDPQTLLIRNCGTGTLNWEIVKDCNWLEVSAVSGQSTGQVNEITLAVDSNSLEPGYHSCILTVLGPNAANSPVTVQVVVHVGVILHVPQEFTTIQAAIDQAIDYDIVLVADDTYTGDGNRDLDFHGKTITVRSESGPNNCIIDCNGTGSNPHRGFYFHNGEDEKSVVTGFTITNGYSWAGAGIYCEVSSPTITNCTIRGNSAEWAGGGISCDVGSSPTITNCAITDNSAGDWGGGISCDIGSSPTITNCTISGNWSDDHGGGISCLRDSSPTITNCTISGNKGRRTGGGIDCLESNPAIINCTIVGNIAARGGGIYISNNSISTTITNCILWDNLPEQIHGHPFITYSDIQQQDEWPWCDHEGCISADPCFVEPGYWDVNCQPYDYICDYFWIEGDYHLLRTSPCVDAANDANVYTDIEGNVRPFDFPGVDNNGELPEFDMGAYELVPVEAAMKFTPQTLNCNSKGNWLKAHLTLPEEFLPEDVDVNESAWAEPMGIESEYIKVLGNNESPVRLEISFDREAFCDLLTDMNDGSLEVTVIGSLTAGRYFYATDTIRIKPRH
jgi:hypothetical protein